MRRRPKLAAVVTETLGLHFSGGCADAAYAVLSALDDAGYDVIEKATRRRQRRHQLQDEALRLAAEEDAAGSRRWVEGRIDEMRRLEDRCTFLYTTAVEHGVPKEALSGRG